MKPALTRHGIVATGILATGALLTLFSLAVLLKTQGELESSRRLLDQLGRASHAMQDAENLMRDFEESGSEKSLRAYGRMLVQVDNDLIELKKLCINNSDALNRIRMLQDTAAGRRDSLERFLRRRANTRRAQPDPEAPIRLGYKSRTTFRVKMLVSSIMDEETRKLHADARTAQSAARGTVLGIALSGLGSFLVWHALVRTNRRELAALTQRSHEQALELERADGARREAEAAIRSKEEMLAALGHELRIPLTPVLMAVSSALDEGKPQADRAFLEMIRRQITLESRLIEDLLDFSRLGRNKLSFEAKPVDGHAILRRALEICREEIVRAGLRVELDLTASEHHVRMDEHRLIQVFWNLVINAAKYSAPRGMLTIRSRNVPSPQEGELDLVLEFEDDGQGIAPELLARIFEPFEQGNYPNRKRTLGLGLGLAISRGIIEGQGGRLSATSPGTGLGSTFRVELPTIRVPRITPAPLPIGGARVAGSAPVSQEARRILVVEDNLDTSRYLVLLLRNQGHDVHSATSITAARALLNEDAFDLLVSDLELPDGSGLELIREQNGRIPGIALSGYGSEEDVQTSLEAGFVAHLTKPVEASHLLDAVRLACPEGEGQSVLRST